MEAVFILHDSMKVKKAYMEFLNMTRNGKFSGDGKPSVLTLAYFNVDYAFPRMNPNRGDLFVFNVLSERKLTALLDALSNREGTLFVGAGRKMEVPREAKAVKVPDWFTRLNFHLVPFGMFVEEKVQSVMSMLQLEYSDRVPKDYQTLVFV